jgi:uncharacterized protein (TIGR02466 family)
MEAIPMLGASAGKLSGVKLWSTMLFSTRWPELESHADLLKAHIFELKQRQIENIESRIAVASKSSHGIVESNFDFFLDPNPSVQALLAYIRQCLSMAVAIANEHRGSEQALSVDVVDSWYHVTNDGGYHDAHFHHGCSWCGIFYLQVGDLRRIGNAAPNGGSRFYCPLGLGGAYRDFGNRYLHASVDPIIEDGMLLLFPSYLLHSGLPYRGAIDRMVIAFNARIGLSSQTVT